MDDLTIALNKCNTGCVIGTTTINHRMYADHDIKYNSKISAVLICKSKYMKIFDVPSFKINGVTIQEVDNVKYLGHFISNTLRDDKDILRQCRQLYARGYATAENLHIKLILLKTFCCPMYTA